MINIILLCLTIWSTRLATCNEEHRTALALKENAINNYHIAVDANNFTDLLRRSTIFVDNSLLIKEILSDTAPSFWMYVCPKKWGKTINLNMIKTFFEMQLDKDGNPIARNESITYKLFTKGEITFGDHVEKLQKPLLIASHTKLIDKHQGQYPVIYVTFKDVVGENLTIVEEKIRLAICRAYKSHRCMIKLYEEKLNQQGSEEVDSSEKERMQKFEDILHNNRSFNIEKSLRHLSEILQLHFKQNVVILMDDYDIPIHNVLNVEKFPEKDVQEISHIMEGLIDKTFKNNKHLFQGVATGTYQFGRFSKGTVNNFVIHHVALKDDPMHEYFGFNQKEIQTLFEMYKIPGNSSLKLQKWYNGHLSKISRQRFYNPTSIVKFLKEKEMKSYWQHDHKDYIQNVIRVQPKIRQTILSIISKHNVYISFPSRNVLTAPDIFYHLRELLNNQGPSLVREESLFNLYLLAEGYLTEVPNSKYARRANNEAAFVMANWMIEYYKTQFRIRDHYFEDAASKMATYVRSRTSSTALLEHSLQMLYFDTKPVWSTVKAMQNINQEQIHSILNSIALRMQCLTKFDVDVFYDTQVNKDDIIALDNDNGGAFIIRLQYDSEEIGNMSKVIEIYEGFFMNLTNVEQVKFLCLTLSLNNSVPDPGAYNVTDMPIITLSAL